uniref:WW domain-containing oxidoreductase n=1 Tax=Timema bartmani TaxID=61472 RepID=A0A7R9ER58_9NEOP|nr:unnamed protein product [Timema bartmani]
MPFGWEKCVSEDGKVFYVDHSNRRTTYTDPRLAFATEEKEHPYDFRQRFDGSTTALQVLHGRDLAGKLAIVTGANTGIGYETARSLAFHGCTVIFACRNMESAQTSIDKIKAERTNTNCEAMELNLSSLHSVKKFATNYKLRFNKVDILILNAGVFGMAFCLTDDNYETLFQVNHLGHFYLTLQLESVLVFQLEFYITKPRDTVSSNFSGVLGVDGFTTTPNYAMYCLLTSSLSAGRTKGCTSTHSIQGIWSALILVATGGLTECFLQSPAPSPSLCCAYSGVVANKRRNFALKLRLLLLVNKDLSTSFKLAPAQLFAPQQAASTTVYCATAPELDNVTGLYFNNCCRCAPSRAAQDSEFAQKLWDISTEMVNAFEGKCTVSEDN